MQEIDISPTHNSFPEFYNAARQALARAASVDEVKNIKNKAEAIRLYAQQQKDDELERYAAQIKAALCDAWGN